ncbi:MULTISPECIES: LysR family transcriptional regulator [Bacillus]|nr:MULTISPECIES: LysR family transcriptional regulator [Bacillus]MEC4201910.1 LysR family transcriptional regulator [Bacillus sp. AAVF1]BCE07603.1 hypothetical protein RSC1_03760 [Bacillus paralicheniformis]BCE09413.1 hypothetical protein RSC2_01209 [Bacillus paralicheniformis]BCE15567.1 hypothetical protein RSC3_02923 [Bacillus paralicheniformis]
MDDRDWVMLENLYLHNNISKTAQILYISQPALTKRIKHIEKEFQVPIIERGTRGIRFTAEGEYLAKCAGEMIERMRQMKETIWNMNQEVVGTIRLGVSNIFAKNMLPNILRLFKNRYPRVDYEVITGLSSEVYNLVYNKKVYFGFVRGDSHGRNRNVSSLKKIFVLLPRKKSISNSFPNCRGLNIKRMRT